MDTTVVIGILVLIALAVAAYFVFGRRRKRAPAPVFSGASEDRTVVGLQVGPAKSDATVVDMRAGGPSAAAPRSDATMVGTAPAASRSGATMVQAAPAGSVARAPEPAPAEAPNVVVGGARQDVTAPTIKVPRTSGRLIITKGGSGTFPIDAREYVIGRSNRADIVVADPSVSGQHARLAVMAGGGATITDLGSSNGTTVNGAKVKGSQPVRSGDMIGVGEAVLRFELS